MVKSTDFNLYCFHKHFEGIPFCYNWFSWNQGGEFGFPLGTYDKIAKPCFSLQTYDTFWEATTPLTKYEEFHWLSFTFKIVESRILHESHYFEWLFKFRGGESTFSCLGCRKTKKASKNIRNFPSDFAMSISPERCRKKEMRLKWMHPQSFNLRHVRKPLYVEQKTHSKKTLVPTWMIIFIDESNNFIEKLHFWQNRCRPTNMHSKKCLWSQWR